MQTLEGNQMTQLPKIIIHTDHDLTPDGKRNWRVVSLTSMGRPVSRIRWYVSGRIFRTLTLTGDNLTLSQQWVDAVSDDEPTDETCPQIGRARWRERVPV